MTTWDKSVIMMFRHINDPKSDLDSIKKQLEQGWVLYDLNDDKAYFTRWTKLPSNPFGPSDSTSSKS